MRILLALSSLPPGRAADKAGARLGREILMALAKWNARLVRAGIVGPLYDSGVVYRRESYESFQDAAIVDRQGWGDCSNLSAWRVGELLARGERARIRLHWRRYSDGFRLYHVTVRREDGRIEDPSRKLGM